MKWGDFRIASWDNLLKALLVIIAILIIAGMIFDAISWHDALNLVKQKVPVSGPAYTWIKGYGYVPLAWRGNFQFVSLKRFTSTKPDKPHDYIGFEVNHKKLVWVWLNGNYGTWNQTERDKELEQSNNWCKQPFGDYCEVYVEEKQISNTQGEVLLIIFGEDRFYVRKFKTKIVKGGCGGGFVSFYWP